MKPVYEEKRSTVQIVEGPNPQLFCRLCNIALVYELHMVGYAMQVINGNTIYRSAVFTGAVTPQEEKDLLEAISNAKKENLQ